MIETDVRILQRCRSDIGGLRRSALRYLDAEQLEDIGQRLANLAAELFDEATKRAQEK